MTITFLPSSPEFSDYRPVFSPCGKYVLYERRFVGPEQDEGPGTRLWIFSLELAKPTVFVKNPPAGVQQTRADWSWADGNAIAFAGISEDCSSIWLVDSDGTGCRQVPCTENMTYPTWYPHGERLAVMHMGSEPGPRTVKIDRDGKRLEDLTNPKEIYAGMPSVRELGTGRWIAFAGQRNTGQPYNENNSQIWVSDRAGHACELDKHQGRAPWWSPNGEWIVFESNRSGKGYAIYAAKCDGSHLIELTDPELGAQHAKWSPNGRSIVFAARQKPGNEGPFRIGILNLSEVAP